MERFHDKTLIHGMLLRDEKDCMQYCYHTTVDSWARLFKAWDKSEFDFSFSTFPWAFLLVKHIWNNPYMYLYCGCRWKWRVIIVWIPLKPWFLSGLRWSLFTFIYNRGRNMNYFIHTSHHFTYCNDESSLSFLLVLLILQFRVCIIWDYPKHKQWKTLIFLYKKT